jgi:nicotinamidase-related amidase
MHPPAALIVIDMQKGMRHELQPGRLPPRNNPDAEDRIAQLLAAWRAAGQPVVWVRHISRSPASVFAPGQPGADFQERFLPLQHEHVVEKNVPCAFVNSGLERWLHARGIRHLVIAGVSTNNSVEASARSAGNLGFDTTVAADACFTFDQRDFGGTLRSAEEVHLMALANLQGDYARVCGSDAVLDELAGQG